MQCSYDVFTRLDMPTERFPNSALIFGEDDLIPRGCKTRYTND
jgi:hypothetical protein